MLPIALLALAPVDLKWSPKPEARAEYAMRALLDLGGKDDVRFTGAQSLRVKSVVDGTVTTATTSQITVDLMGIARQGRAVESERTERIDGSLLRAEEVDSTLLFAVPRVERLMVFRFPKVPVEPGTGWWRTEAADGKVPPYATYCKLEGEEKVLGRDSWRTSVDAHESDDPSPVHVKAMLWLDKADGSLVRGQWAVEGYIPNATTPALKVRYELTRVELPPTPTPL